MSHANFDSLGSAFKTLGRQQHRADRPHRFEQEAVQTAAVLDLVEGILESDALDQASQKLVVQLQAQFTGCRVYFVAFKSSSRPGRLIANSDGLKPDRSSRWTLSLERLGNDCRGTGRLETWSPSEGDPSHPAVQDLIELLPDDCQRISALPLQASTTTPAVLIILESESTVDEASPLAFLKAASPSLAIAFSALSRAECGRVAAFGRRVGAEKKAVGRSRMYGLTALAMLAGLCIPVTHRVSTSIRAEPVHRRYVAAPFDATLERSFVKPGDLVEKDAVIAKLDGRSITWKRAAVVAEQLQARKKRDAAQATRNYAEQQIAQLEIEQQEIELSLLDERIRRLDILSPIDGIVTSGDLARAEGVPVTLGQSLFEIAPLDRITAELEIADRDIAYVEPNQKVEMRFDAVPGKLLEGTIAQIRPRAEIRDNANVFIADVELDNGDGSLRPGMKGRASILGSKQAYGWILLHEPIEYLLRWCAW